jgi:hypothetical protein
LCGTKRRAARLANVTLAAMNHTTCPNGHTITPHMQVTEMIYRTKGSHFLPPCCLTPEPEPLPRAGICCPDGHDGPFDFVERSRKYWDCAVVGGVVVVAHEPSFEDSDEELEGPPMLLCRADVGGGDECLAEVVVDGSFRVVRD